MVNGDVDPVVAALAIDIPMLRPVPRWRAAMKRVDWQWWLHRCVGWPVGAVSWVVGVCLLLLGVGAAVAAAVVVVAVIASVAVLGSICLIPACCLLPEQFFVHTNKMLKRVGV